MNICPRCVPMPKEYDYSVLLDTSFLLRLLSRSDELFENADGFFRMFLEKGIPMYVSTIAIGEFCVRNKWEEAPSKNLRILPYNTCHAFMAGQFTKILLDAKNRGDLTVSQRNVIPNDVKQLAQAQTEDRIRYFVTSDSQSWKKYSSIIEKEIPLKYDHLDIRETEYQTFFGTLDLK